MTPKCVRPTIVAVVKQ